MDRIYAKQRPNVIAVNRDYAINWDHTTNANAIFYWLCDSVAIGTVHELARLLYKNYLDFDTESKSNQEEYLEWQLS